MLGYKYIHVLFYLGVES